MANLKVFISYRRDDLHGHAQALVGRIYDLLTRPTGALEPDATNSLRMSPIRLYAWFAGNSDYKTHPVAKKKLNSLGLCDMYGNVWEWCCDRYSDYPSVEITDPTSPKELATGRTTGAAWVFAHSGLPNIRYGNSRTMRKRQATGRFE